MITNGTFVGEGVCSGEGVFGVDDPSGNLTVLDGEGFVSGSGIFHFPQGLFNGTGTGLNLVSEISAFIFTSQSQLSLGLSSEALAR